MDICIFTGRATKDPVVRTNGDSQIASFSLAVDTGYGDNKKANFFNMVAFGKTADSIDKYVRQGTKLIVYSEAQQNVWTDKDGKKRYDVNFIVRQWEFAESKRDGSQNGQGTADRQASGAATDGFINVADGISEELPFA